MLNDQYRTTIAKVANNAIPLTDSFGFTDFELNTALGKKDGRAYEHFWDAVQNNPVNSDAENVKLRVSTYYNRYKRSKLIFIYMHIYCRNWF